MRKKLFISIFFLLCLLPSLGMAVFGPSPLLANEVAPRTPKLNASLFTDITDYVGRRFAFRPYLVSARSFLWEKFLKSSAEEQVILGSDGELFYGSTLDDYCGVGLSDGELRQIASRLAGIQAAVEADGGRFLFTVAPNKNTVVPGAMPRRFPFGHESSNYVRLLPLLEEYGVHCVDLRPLFEGNPELYYRTDSHWTPEGAALAADELLRAAGRESSFADGAFREEGLHIGDLYQMLYPTGKGREPELVYDPGFRHVTASDPRGGNAVTIRTSCPAGTGSLFCLRDSFGIALYPYLAEAFAEAEFSRSLDDMDARLAGSGADVVLLEIVERNLAALLPDPGAVS